MTGLRRVLMTTDAVGGVWTYALELASGLANAHVNLELAVLGPEPDPSQLAAARAIPGLHLHVHPFKLEWMDDPWPDVARAGDWLLELAARLRPDVVHVNGFSHGALPFRAPAVVVAHSCVLSWYEAVRGHAAPAATWARYAAAVAAGLRGADAVVAPSRAMRDALLRNYPAARARPVDVIANGCDASVVLASSVKEEVVVSAGRLWDEAKNLRALLAAAPRMTWALRIAGDTAPRQEEGPSSEMPRAGSAGLSVSPTVELCGRLPHAELRALLARAAIYALPARYEPFGLSVLEAAQASCALVLGDIPSLRENWDEAALFVPPNDSDALARAVNALAGDPELRGRLGALAYQRAQRFSAARMHAEYLAMYGRLLGEHAPSRLGEVTT